MNCGICLITRLTPLEYLREWVEWYLKSIGFDMVWIYDGNQDGEEERVPQLESEGVHVIKWPERYSQLKAYTDFIAKQKSGEYEHMDWVATFDDDEFLMIESPELKIKDILRDHKTDSLGVNQLVYGSSGLKRRAGDSQIESFVMRTPISFPENRIIKMIAKTDKIDGVNQNLTFNVRSLTTDVKSRLCTDFDTDYPMDSVIWVNHYFTRSRQEFQRKINRGRADSQIAPRRNIGYFDLIDKISTIRDDRAILRKQKTLKSQQN